MIRKFDKLIKFAEEEIKKKGVSGYLHDLIEAFKEMRASLNLKGKAFQSVKNQYSGLGRVITDDYEFSESELGSKMLELLEEYLKL